MIPAWLSVKNTVSAVRADASSSPSVSCEDAALRLVARAEQFSAGLRRKLLLRGFSRTEVFEVCTSFAEKGLIDDLRYGTLWVAARLRRNRSRIKHKNETPNILYAKLRAKGIDGATARAAVRAAFEHA